MQVMNRKGKETKYPSFTIYDLKNKLDSGDNQQNAVRVLIEDYFSYPDEESDIPPKWNFSKSALLQLREIRNNIAHSNIFNRSYVVGAGEKSSSTLRFDVSKIKEKIGKLH